MFIVCSLTKQRNFYLLCQVYNQGLLNYKSSKSTNVTCASIGTISDSLRTVKVRKFHVSALAY